MGGSITKRVPEIELMKAIAIVGMVLVHVLEGSMSVFVNAWELPGSIPYTIVEFFGCIPAAGAFTFAMGLGAACSKTATTRSFLKRALTLGLLILYVNFMYAILPMLSFMKDAPYIDSEARRVFSSLDTLYADGWEGRNMGIACEDQLSGKLSQSLGILNIEDGVMEAKVDLRCPVHIDLEQIWKTTDLNCRKYGFHPEYWQMRPPLYIPKEAPLVETLLSVYNEMMDDNASAITIGGGTYCRDVTNFVSFGPVFPYEKELAHEANEYIGLNEFMMSAKLYAQALYALLKPEK